MNSARRRLAVTLATRVYEPESTAAAHRLANLVGELEARGHSVTVLTVKAPGARRSTSRVRRWPVLRDRSGSVRGYLQYLSFDVPLFFRLLFGPRADVVVVEPPPTTGFVTRIACRLRRTPYAYYAADVLSIAVRGLGVGRLIVNAVTVLEKTALRGAACVLTVSDETRERLMALGVPAQRVSTVGTGVDTARFSARGPIERPGLPYFIYTGTMSEVHGAGVFIDAFLRLTAARHDAALRVYGSGVDYDVLRRRTEHLGYRVRFAKALPPDQLAPWIRGAVAGLASVHPDRGYDFAYATKALTSLSCGTPVIYAGSGPLSAAITEQGLGWAVDWDPDAVAEAMTEALRRQPVEPDQRLAAWVAQNHSLKTVASRAADTIIGSLAPGR